MADLLIDEDKFIEVCQSIFDAVNVDNMAYVNKDDVE